VSGVAFTETIFSDFVQDSTRAKVPTHARAKDSGGSRIVSIPFTVIEDAIPGTYGIKVLQAGQGKAPGEMAPLNSRVINSPESPGDLWLLAGKHDDPPLLTPAPMRAY
jgi:hypothetical protein